MHSFCFIYLFILMLFSFFVIYIHKFYAKVLILAKIFDIMSKKVGGVMLKIAVCDDEEKTIDKIKRFVLKYAEINDLKLQIFGFFDGNDLVASNQQFDLIFLDIEMQFSNGIQTAQRIREKDVNVPIVYITNYSQYWRNAYKVHAFDYISKPFDFIDIRSVMDDFIKSLSASESKTVSFNTEEGAVVLNINEICYFLVKDKKTVLVGTIYSELIVKEYLLDILKKLPEERFFKAHRSCVVNLEFVQNFHKDDGIIMRDGTWLPMSSRKQKDFLYKLSKYLGKDEK